MASPAARVGDSHLCPVHGVGRIGLSIQQRVLINEMPAATAGSLCQCPVPAPNGILRGSPTVFIGNLPVARVLDPTMHGGVITSGANNVLIGDYAGAAAARVFPGLQNRDNCQIQCCQQIIHQLTGNAYSEEQILQLAHQEGHALEEGDSHIEGAHNLLIDHGLESDIVSEFDDENPDSRGAIRAALTDALRNSQWIIAGVNAPTFWDDQTAHEEDYAVADHAILITEGEFNEQGQLTHVYTTDTSREGYGRRRTTDQLLDAMHVTHEQNGEYDDYYEMLVMQDSIRPRNA